MSPAVRYRALGALLVLITALWSGYALFADAPAVDETPHLAAGIGYVQQLAYRLNPEHPPLIKVFAGAFAQVVQPRLPTDAPWWDGGINEQWRAGDAVLWGGDRDAGALLALGRLGVALLNLGLLLIGWRAVARRWGEAWGVALVALVALSPFFLGHAHLVTTDVAAAGAGALACAAFAAFLNRPGLRSGALAVVALGVAELAKFSLVLLVPAFLAVAALHGYRGARSWPHARLLLKQTAVVIVAAYSLVVYPAYLALTLRGEPEISRRDAAFLLSSFAGGPTDRLVRPPQRYAADLAIALSGSKLTQPAGTYLLGVLMVAQRSAGGNTAYFLGSVSAAGSRLYFPVVYAAKETLPALAILIAGLWLYRRERQRGGEAAIGRRVSPELVLAVFAALYLAMTFRSSLNIGIRHLFPVILAGYLVALAGWREAARRDRRFGYALAGALALHGAVGILSLPYPLAYYNPLAGGTAHGYLVAADSNYDWGQDALRLRRWMDEHPEEGLIAVDLFGGSDPQALLGPRAIAWWSARGNPAEYGIRWLAVSSSYLLTATQGLANLEPRLTIDEYRWLQALRGAAHGTVPEPDARAGTSIFLYRLD